MVARTGRRAVLLLILVLLIGHGPASPHPIAATHPSPTLAAVLPPAPHVGNVFRNLDPEYKRAPMWMRARAFVVGASWLASEHRVAPLALATPHLQALSDNSGRATVTWVGHSTVLVQLDGLNFLTDPTWADRTGPFHGLVGVRRYTPPGIRFEDLPPIDFVLISHDHYDHLDEATVRRLARAFNPRFVVPLGIKAWLEERGITNAVELNWGEAITIGGLEIVCTPAQHSSGRTLADQGRRLWASWAVLGSRRFYFAGDTGYYRHFKEIGDALGPFDLAALPIGSYTPRAIARPVHISPEEAVKASLDLRAARMVGIHWGTFALAREPYDEPPTRLAAEAARRAIDAHDVWVLKPGETRDW